MYFLYPQEKFENNFKKRHNIYTINMLCEYSNFFLIRLQFNVFYFLKLKEKRKPIYCSGSTNLNSVSKKTPSSSLL
jgi:hypothetical protein